MPNYDKWVWWEIKISTGEKFYISEEQLISNYSNLVGQHMSRFQPYNHFFEKVEDHGDVIKVKKIPDNSIRIHYNMTTIGRKVDKKVEVIE